MTTRDDSEQPPDRVRRNAPARTEPRRHPSQMFGDWGAPADGAATAAGPKSSGSLNGSSEGARTAVQMAVECAYRVMDDYLQWGRAAAEGYAAAMPPFGAVDPRPGWQGPGGDWLQAWQSAYYVWARAWMAPWLGSGPLSGWNSGTGAGVGGPGPWGVGGGPTTYGPVSPWDTGSSAPVGQAPGAGPFGVNPPPPPPPESQPMAGTPPSASSSFPPLVPVDLEVDSVRRVKVRVRLQRVPSAEVFVVFESGAVPGLTVQLEGTTARVGVDIAVPAGVYVGEVLAPGRDASTSVLGELVVEVADHAESP